VGEDALPRALGLRRRAAARVRPVVGGGGPRGPVDVPRGRPVRDRIARVVQDGPVLGARRPERGGDLAAVHPQHLAELLPGRRLVVARGDIEPVVVAAEARGAADVRPPGVPAVRADVPVAGIAGRTDRVGLVPDRSVELAEAVLVQLARHHVGAEHVDVDPDAAVAVLHPIAREGAEAVVLARDRVVVVHPLVDVLGRDRLPPGLRVAERVRLGRLADQERLVRKLDEDDGRLVLVLRARGRAVVELGMLVGHGDVVVPGQVLHVEPVLRVDRLEEGVVGHVGRHLRRAGPGRERGRGDERRRQDQDRPRARRSFSPAHAGPSVTSVVESARCNSSPFRSGARSPISGRSTAERPARAATRGVRENLPD
jgi:hypothetical protein